LSELPPPVVADFWEVVDAAVKVVDRARDDQLLGEGGERENLDKLCTMLTRTLKLYNDALRRAAIPEATLEKQLEKWHPEPELEEVLLRRYFYQIRGLMARTVEYAQAVLDAYDRHPVFVMDVNILLDAIERFTGYVRNSGGASPETSNMDALYLLRAIAGEADTWLDRTSPFSEFNMLSGAAGTTPEKWKDRGRHANDTRQYLTWVWSGISAGEVGELREWREKAWGDRKLNPKITYARDPAAFAEYLARAGRAQGDDTMWEHRDGAVLVRQTSWRLMDEAGAQPPEVFDAWTELWRGAALARDARLALHTVRRRDAGDPCWEWRISLT
jgi:hypothetical protein